MARPTSRRGLARQRPRASRTRWGLGAGLALVAVAAVVAALLALRPGGALPARATLAPEPADGCRALPPFARDPALGLVGSLALATDQPEKGLVLRSLSEGGASYQHPSWDDAGYLGALAYDSEGSVYVAPTPRLSLADNPLAGAATLWRVDGRTGLMAPFVTLPGTASERNPFGVLGLTYACGLDTLYAGTVIGSTPSEERGGVLAIGRDGQIRGAALADTDVMGVLVVRVGAGYELYAGLARSPQVVAVSLDARGLAVGQPRPLLDLTAAGAAPSERVRKLRLVAGELVADLVPFNFSLQSSASGQPQTRQAAWRYDPAAGAWVVSRAATGP